MVREDAVFCHKCGFPVNPGPTKTASTAGVSATTGFELLEKNKTTQDHWARRVIAYVIDSIIVAVALAVLGILFAIPVFLTSGFPGSGFLTAWWGISFGGVFLLVILAYFILAEGFYSRTIGKEIMGLRVARLDGRPVDIGASFLRNISKVHFILLIVDTVAGLAMRGEPTQKFSDRIAGTVVQSARKVTIIS